MGRDKYENEDLIKHGWPEDVWFHVDKVTASRVEGSDGGGDNVDGVEWRDGLEVEINRFFYFSSRQLTSTYDWLPGRL